jgi:hypothetical protein
MKESPSSTTWPTRPGLSDAWQRTKGFDPI